MSYIGHGLSHSVFGGAVVSYVMAWNFYLGAGAWGFLSALLINAVARRRKIRGRCRDRHRHDRVVRGRRRHHQQTAKLHPQLRSGAFRQYSWGEHARRLDHRRRHRRDRAGRLPRLQATALHDVRRRSGPDLRRAHQLGRRRIRPGAGRDHRRLDQHRRRDPDRGGHRDSADHRAAADRFVRADDRDLDRARGNLRRPPACT